MLQSIFDLCQKLVTVKELLVQCGHFGLASFIGEQCQRITTVYHLKGCRLKSCLKGGVVAVLGPWQSVQPAMWLISCKIEKVDSQNLVRHLRLSVSVQNVLVKTRSRSLTMEHVMSWSLTMLSKKTLVMETTVYGWPSGMKWVYMEKWSTTIRTTYLLPTRGKPSMKSMVMSAHTTLGSSRGCSNLAGWTCSDLFRWHTTHLLTYPLSVFSAPARYRVVKIARSSSDVVLRTIKHTLIYPGLDPSSEVINLCLVVWYRR
jgi:hypothetical protein